MKVSLCEKCEHYKRKTWSKSYKPNAYHAIGVTHAYAYCTLHNARCLSVKNCGKGAHNDPK